MMRAVALMLASGMANAAGLFVFSDPQAAGEPVATHCLWYVNGSTVPEILPVAADAGVYCKYNTNRLNSTIHTIAAKFRVVTVDKTEDSPLSAPLFVAVSRRPGQKAVVISSREMLDCAGNPAVCSKKP